jgi:Caspase domain
MEKRDLLRCGLALTTLQTLTVAGAIGQERPLSQAALVIGNNTYSGNARLVNASRDAKLMHETLTKLGARSELVTDLSGDALVKSIERFALTLRKQPIDIAWFFFSGHGALIDGKNLLLGTDVSATNAEQLKSKSFNLSVLEGMLDQIKPQVAIVIIDACRDNPFSTTQATTSGTRGLPAGSPGMILDKWSGKLIAYSTAPFTKALDWSEQTNGPYAKALSKALLEKHPRALEKVFEAAADEVFRSTNGVQIPGYYSELRRTVTVQSDRVSLATLPASNFPTLPPAVDSAKDKTPNQTTAKSYRPDLIIKDQYENTSKEAWAEKTFLLETKAKHLDRFEAISAIKVVKNAKATDSDLTLAGILLGSGFLVEKNRQLAAKAYERAALRGFVTAQTLLGELEYDRQNFAQSYKWLVLAAKSGWGRPKLNLAQLLMQGRGTPQDFNQAFGHIFEAMKDVIPKTTAPAIPR